jgi:hypothetical protein
LSADSDVDRSYNRWNFGKGKERRKTHTRSKPFSARRMPILEAYSGKTNFQAFDFQFRRMMEMENWSKKDAVGHLFDWLKDEALKVALTCGATKFTSLMKRLKSAFGKRMDVETAQLEFRELTQAEDQTIAGYYAEVLEKAHDAYPTRSMGASQFKQLLVLTFLHGLLDTKAAFAILSYRSPKDIHEAFKDVKQHIIRRNSLLGARAKTKASRVFMAAAQESDSESGLEDEVQVKYGAEETKDRRVKNITKKLTEVATRVPSKERKLKWADRERGSCFYCGEQHMIRDCQTRIDDEVKLIKTAFDTYQSSGIQCILRAPVGDSTNKA